MLFEVFLFRNISRLDLHLACEHSVCSFSLPCLPLTPFSLSPTQHLYILSELQLKSSLSHSDLCPNTVWVTTEVICPHSWGRGAALKIIYVVGDETGEGGTSQNLQDLIRCATNVTKIVFQLSYSQEVAVL